MRQARAVITRSRSSLVSSEKQSWVSEDIALRRRRTDTQEEDIHAGGGGQTRSESAEENCWSLGLRATQAIQRAQTQQNTELVRPLVALVDL
ncbi:uncharacterized [Tachysurus ichikawai]